MQIEDVHVGMNVAYKKDQSAKGIVKAIDNQLIWVEWQTGPHKNELRFTVAKHLEMLTEECVQTKPHVHVDLIKAWADGATIEILVDEPSRWEVVSNPSWNPDWKYRIKPKDIVYFSFVYEKTIGSAHLSLEKLKEAPNPYAIGICKVTIDAATKQLKSIEVVENLK
jgi:hypothetical protein